MGSDEPVLVIAEAGVNHNGSRERGLELVRAAAAAGARAVKFQSFAADEVAVATAPLAEYQKRSETRDQVEMLRELELPMPDLAAFMAEGRRLGIVAFSTPFDPKSVAGLVSLGVEVMKIPSGEITNVDLTAGVVSTLPEVAAAVERHRRENGGPLALLHCVSSYPAPLSEMNLRAMETLRTEFGVPVGLSDHSQGIETDIIAVALGAVIIEKHFTLDRRLPGPDHAMSTEPAEFTELVRAVERTRAALGNGIKTPVPSEIELRRISRRSIVTARAIPAGTVLTRELIAFKRPGGGIDPTELASVLGRRASRDLAPDVAISRDDLR
ncbi:MAG: N-acetylneuraminate synthase [Chloroflexi bacterium]|nr:MAG: N-acetylneuraminate synthase [Chloroflexota bacterium]